MSSYLMLRFILLSQCILIAAARFIGLGHSGMSLLDDVQPCPGRLLLGPGGRSPRPDHGHPGAYVERGSRRDFNPTREL